MQRYIALTTIICFLAGNFLAAQTNKIMGNLLMGTTYTQSSYDDETSHDDKTSHDAHSSSFICPNTYSSRVETGVEKEPYVQFDLGNPAQLDKLTLDFPRADYPDGMDGLYILMSRYPMEFTDLESLLASEAVEHVAIEAPINSGTSIPLGKRTARYLRIQSAKPTRLSFLHLDLTGAKDLYEIAGNDIDDDRDGLTDKADKDMRPLFRSVMTLPPTCKGCSDGRIQVQAGGDDLSISMDGGITFQKMEGEMVTLHANSGHYNLVLAAGNGNTSAYPQNPVQVQETADLLVSNCGNGNFNLGWQGWTGRLGNHNANGVTFTQNGIATPRHQIVPVNPGIPVSDPNVAALLLSPPSPVNRIARLGNITGGNNDAQELVFTFIAAANNANFTFEFATVMWQHSTTGPVGDEAFFNCFVTAGGTTLLAINVNPQTNMTNVAGSLFFTPWQCVNVNLNNFIGQPITVTFQSAGCNGAGHGGYAYIAGLCEVPVAAQVNISNTTCPGVPITASANGGLDFAQYQWLVEKVDANGNQVPGTLATGIIQTGTNVSPLTNVLGFWTNLSGIQAACNDRIKVTLRLLSGCTSVQSSTIFTAPCLPTLDYCDMSVCNGAGAFLQIQGTGTCPNCTFQWQPPANMNNSAAMFPTITNPAALGTTYNVIITMPNGCTTAQSVRVVDATLSGTISLGPLICVDKCTVKMQAYFVTTKPLNTAMVTVNVSQLNNVLPIAFTYTTVQNLPNGVKRYIFTSSAFENRANPQPNQNTPKTYILSIRSTPPPAGFCSFGVCPSSISATVSVQRGMFHGIPSVYIPNIFSPNSPVVANQLFYPSFSTGYSPDPGVYWMEMEIYDQWGELLYEKTYDSFAPNCSTANGLLGNESGFPWNGYFRDKKCDAAVYTYIIRYRNCTQTWQVYGDVTLVW